MVAGWSIAVLMLTANVSNANETRARVEAEEAKIAGPE
jgi:hypothetical protein